MDAIAIAKDWICTDDEYHADKAIGSSMLRTFSESPALFFSKHITRSIESEQSDDLLVGRFVHWLVLEGSGDCPYVAAPQCDRRTKDGKAIYAEFLESANGKTVLSADNCNLSANLAKAVRSSDVAMRLLNRAGCINESAIKWTDAETGIECKAKPDCRSVGLLVDLKTTQSAHPQKFLSSVTAYGYHQQAAWYLDGVNALEGIDERSFVFIAVAKKPPYEVGVYELDQADIEHGRELNRRAMDRLSNCLITGDWRADWQKQIVTISLSQWQRKSEFEL